MPAVETGRTPLAALIRAEARIGLRGAPLRAALALSALLGWSVGGAAGDGAGLSALTTGDTACIYIALAAVYWLALAAARDASTSTTAIVLSKPQPMERLVLARFVGGYLQVLALLVALFIGAAASRGWHSGSFAGFIAYPGQFVRAAVVLFVASSAAYTLALMAGTPLAGALAGMYWLVTLGGHDFLAKVYYPYYTQNLAAFTLLGVFLIGLTALVHRRSRRGGTPPTLWSRWLWAIGLLPALVLFWRIVESGHDPMLRESPFMAEVSRQDAYLEKRAPGFMLPDQRGRLVSLSDMPGRICLVALLSPHSEEGILLLDRLRDLQRRYGTSGVQPVAICIANDQGAARSLAHGEGLAFPVLVDWGSHHAPKAIEASPTAAAYRVTDFPYVAVTDRRRRIRAIIEGISAYDGPQLEQAIRQRIEEEPR